MTNLDKPLLVWVCPLCGWTAASADINAQAAAHGAEHHPASFPTAMTIGQRLAWIAAIVPEVTATLGHPNPADRAMAAGGARIDSGRVPADLAGIDALQPGEGVSVPYTAPAATLVRCSRIIWAALDPDQRAAHPQPIGTPTAATEAAWAAKAWPAAKDQLTPNDRDHIDADTTHIVLQLAAVTRTRPMPAIPCLTEGCHGQVQALAETANGWLWSDVCTDNHRVDRHTIARIWADQQPMTAAQIAERLNLTDRTIRRWAEAGLIQAIGRRWKAPLYRLDDAHQILEKIRPAC